MKVEKEEVYGADFLNCSNRCKRSSNMHDKVVKIIMPCNEEGIGSGYITIRRTRN